MTQPVWLPRQTGQKRRRAGLALLTRVLAMCCSAGLLDAAPCSAAGKQHPPTAQASAPPRAKTGNKRKSSDASDPRDQLRASQITEVAHSPLGTTLYLRLHQGPFPAPSKPYQDDTTIVFVPQHFRSRKQVDVLVHFHGHNVRIRQKMAEHALREQVHDSGRNVLLVMPQGPEDAADSSGGKLENSGAFRLFVDEVVAVLRTTKARQALAAAALDKATKVGAIALSSHSGGYRVTARVLRHGGYPVREVYLFDSLYGDVDDYVTWLHGKAKGRKLISWYVVDTPARLNQTLRERVQTAKGRVIHETHEGTHSRASLRRARAVFIHTTVPHGRTPVRHNNLRDALLASGFARSPRAPPDPWGHRLNGPRPIDER